MSKLFRKKIEDFTNARIKLTAIWNKLKIQSLVKYKDKGKQQLCDIFVWCRLHRWNVGNSQIIRNELNTGKDVNSDCAKHLNYNFDHEFWWFVLSCASANSLKLKMPDVYYIKTCQSSVFSQTNSDILNLYRNGVT